jgi:hypothetical protein
MELKTPRGTLGIKAMFANEMEATEAGYYIYFNDDEYDVYTKHISEYSVKFALVRR